MTPRFHPSHRDRYRLGSVVRQGGFALCIFFFCMLDGSRVDAQENSTGRLLSADDFRSGSRVLRAFIPVIEQVRDSVVSLRIDGKAVALGAVIDADGLIITKASELKPGELLCRLSSGREVKARVVATDDDNDVALLKAEISGLKPVEWRNGTPAVGQWVVTPGINEKPEAIGILSVPERKIPHARALIGVEPDFAAAGARIARVMSGFGAEKAGLQAGDVILAVNGQDVGSAEELVQALRKFRAGQTVALRYKRGDDERTAPVQLMAPPPREENGPRRFQREERMNRLGGDVSSRAEGFELAIQHDSVLQPWQCGGPLIDLDGKAVGLNIARAARIASYALPAELVKEIIKKLKSSQSQRED